MPITPLRISPILLLLLLRLGSFEVVEIGNPPTTSTSTLYPVRDIAFLLLDLTLPSGTLREYRMSIAQRGTPRPVRLQLWRPAGGANFTLVADVEFLPFGNGTYRVYPGDDVRVEAGDRVGFLSRGDHSSVVYDFLPAAPGTHLVARSFRGLLGAPAIGHGYTFDSLTYDIWRFSFGVKVDTDYGVGSLPPLLPTTWPRRPDPRPGPNTSLPSVGETIEQSSGGSTSEAPSLLWLAIVLPVIYVVITCSATIYAIYHVLWKNKKVTVTAYDNPVSVTVGNDLVIRRRNIVVHEVISDGHIGTIYRAEVFGLAGKSGWENVSLKMLGDQLQTNLNSGSACPELHNWHVLSKTETASDHLKYLLLREIEAMKALRPNPNVLQLLGYCIEQDHPVLIVESVPLGNLRDHLREARDSSLEVHIVGHDNFTITGQLVSFGAQVARGMAYLSSMRMLHRGLCARNVLLADGRVCKITSFSFIQDVMEHHEYQRVTQSPQPVRWMAPESLSGNVYTSKSDVFSMGTLLWEVITLGATPYPDLDTAKVIRNVKKGSRMHRPPHCKQELYHIAESCWHTKPSDRPSFDLLVRTLDGLHGQNLDLIQLEKYPGDGYGMLSAADCPLEIL